MHDEVNGSVFSGMPRWLLAALPNLPVLEQGAARRAAQSWSASALRRQGPGKVVTGVRLELIGTDAPLLEAARRA